MFCELRLRKVTGHEKEKVEKEQKTLRERGGSGCFQREGVLLIRIKTTLLSMKEKE